MDIKLSHKTISELVINGTTSQPMTIKSGVPQGSVLGPLLFLIYINSICDLPLSSQCRLVLYADDLVLFKVTQTSADYLEFQNDINRIVRWVDANLLTLNSSKCKCMLLTCKTTIMTPLHLGTCMLGNNSGSEELLGVHVTADLRWDVHISGICLKAKRLLGLLYRKFYRSVDSAFLFRLYLSLVRPLLEYACPVWDPYTFKNIKTFALKIRAHHWDTGYCTLLDMFNIASLETRRKYLKLITFYKIVHSLSIRPTRSSTGIIVIELSQWISCTTCTVAYGANYRTSCVPALLSPTMNAFRTQFLNDNNAHSVL